MNCLFLPIAVLVHCRPSRLVSDCRPLCGNLPGDKDCQAVIVSVVILLGAGILIMRSSAIHVAVMDRLAAPSPLFFFRRPLLDFYERSLRELTAQVRILIVGAGSAAEMIIRSIQKNSIYRWKWEQWSTTTDLRNMEIHGVPIMAPLKDSESSKPRHRRDLIAIPSGP